jgi:Camelysin metallo-endopeptidase
MDRVRLVAGSHRWLLLASLALLTLALGTAMFSGASFSSKSVNSGSLAAGTIQLTSSKANQAIVVEGVSAMEPGDSASGAVTVGNQGNVPAKVTLKAADLAGMALAEVLDLKIENTVAKAQVWSGKLSALAGGIELSQFGANETRQYLITLSWPAASSSPSLQGAATSFSFQWSATATQ